MTTLLKHHYGQLPERDFDLRAATAEATRCLLCHDAPCSAACPAQTDPGKFIRSLRLRNIRGAIETIRENNPLAGCCALVCPYDTLCERGCSRSGIDRPIEIGRLQRFLVGQEMALNMQALRAGPLKGMQVLCIGAGPASLACASGLAVLGYAVSIYEANEKPGGVLAYGISPSRLPQDVVDHDIGLVEQLGVRIIYGKTVVAEHISALQQQFAAIFIGTGLWKSKLPDIPGVSLAGVLPALDYLREARTQKTLEKGDHVLVIGGGDVAMDCAATAKQLGAEHTSIVYRRSMAEAPANREELRRVQAMGIPVITGFTPEEILGEAGRVAGMRFKGRDGYSSLLLKADKVIFAIGQERREDFPACEGIIFGGDYANGGKTVVEAVAEGKAAARAIHANLEARQGGR